MAKDVVLLFHPRTFHERNYRYFHIPYSLLSAVVNLDSDRYEVILIDNNVVAKDNFESDLGRLRGRLLCVGISAMIGHQITDGLAFAKAVRTVDEHVPIVWGGALPTVLPEITIAHESVDIIACGQGQETLPALISAISDGSTLQNIPGIVYKHKGEIFYNPARPFSDINRFPTFRNVYNLINIPDYIRCDEHINSRTVSYHSSQGCPFNCGFCSETALWKNRWSGLNPEHIVNDLRYLTSCFDINGIKFYDAEFFISQLRTLNFARTVVDQGLTIKWAAAVHPRNLDRLSNEQFSLLQDSGASRLLMGAESGVQQELELIGKRTDRELLVRLANRCSQHSIVASFSFVTGYPGMPVANVQATLDFASELAKVDPNHEVKVHFFAPYPGTPLYPLAIQHGFIPPASLVEWANYDYYDVTTPWVDKAWEPIVRAFNEQHYTYLQTAPAPIEEQGPVKLCPLL